MSNISLYSGLYESIRQWADLIDDSLIELRTNTSNERSSRTNQLKNLFSRLNKLDFSKTDFSDRRVATLVEIEMGKKIDWSHITHNLEENTQLDEVIILLEKMAQCLAKRHADTVTKMRWGNR